MRWSKAFIPTIKEAPVEAEITSHKLMLRAGLIRRLSSGLYTYLPFCLRVIKKVGDIIRDEMNKKGAEELLMPILQPTELWEKSGRLNSKELAMLTAKDRTGREFVLSPTHEEVITDLVGREIKSYRDLPKNFYQIQTKFRDELRPRSGLMRAKEFIMKDSYSFDVDEESAGKTYAMMESAYRSIFSRCGLNIQVVKADPGAMGGGMSHEFIALADIGEEENGIEVGQIFSLGTKYSKSIGATFLDKNGVEKLCVMGCFGIGVTRTISAIIEQNHDEYGIMWPLSVSPYQVLILPVNISDSVSRGLAEKVYNQLQERKVEVLLDDRDVRGGVKFKDADLIGVPVRITVGSEKAASGALEIRERRTGREVTVRADELIPNLMSTLQEENHES